MKSGVCMPNLKLTAITLGLLSVTLSVGLTGCKTKSESAPGTETSSSGTASPGGATEQTASDPNSPIRIATTKGPGANPESTIDGAEVMLARYPKGVYGGTLKRSLVMSDPKTFNYWAANDAASREIAALMHYGLFDMDPHTGELMPALAKSMKLDADNMTYTVTLRKGLKWSDGHPLTADDVVYTWNTLIAGGYGNSSLRDVTQVDGKSPEVTKIDDVTVKFKTAKPFAPFIHSIGMSIAPKHIAEKVTNLKNGRDKFNELWNINTKPSGFVTSGPFILEEYVPGQRVVLHRSKNFFEFSKDENGKEASLPYMDRLTYLVVPDVNTNLLKFKAKEIDMTIVRCRDAGDLAKEAKALDFKLHDLGPSSGSTFIMFNMNQRKNPKTGKPYVDPVKSAWFNDTNFRQAINYAIDRTNIVNNYFKGLGSVAYMADTTEGPFANPALKKIPKDIEKAKEYLKKSGFTWDKEGQLHDKDGHRVEFDLLSSSGGTFYAFVGVAFKEDMKALGIKVNFAEINGNTLNDKVSQSLDWQAGLFSLTGSPIEPHEGANVYRSDSRLHLFDLRLPGDDGKTVVTDARPWEKEVDKLLEEGAQIMNQEARKKPYYKIQEILYNEAPFIYIACPKTIVGARNTMHNYDPTALTQDSAGLHNLPEIWIK